MFGNRVVSALGRIVRVEATPVGSAGWIVKVADTPMLSVVGSTGCNVRVVMTSGTVAGRSPVTAGAVRVTGVSGRRVVSALGIIVIVEARSVGFAGSIVKVADTPPLSVVGPTGWSVRVVITSGTVAGRFSVTAGTVKVTGVSGSRVVSAPGIIVIAEAISVGSTGWMVNVADTPALSVVGSSG